MKKIALWVEGASDRRFFDAIIKPKLERHFDVVKIVEYSVRFSQVNKLLQSMSHQGFEYLFVADQDETPCISARREKLQKRFPALEPTRIVVVGREIEAWYVAGLGKDAALGLRMKSLSQDCETKEQFLKLIAEPFTSSVDLMVEILQVFDYQLACEKNRSFAYFDSKLKWIVQASNRP